MSIQDSLNVEKEVAENISKDSDLAFAAETVSPVAKYAEVHPIVNLPSQKPLQPLEEGVYNPKPHNYPATPLIVRSSHQGKKPAINNYQAHRSIVPAPLRILSKSSGSEDIKLGHAPLSKHHFTLPAAEAHPTRRVVKTSLQNSSLFPQEPGFEGKVAKLRRQVESHAHEASHQAADTFRPPNQAQSHPSKSPQLSRDLSSLIHQLEARASDFSRSPKLLKKKGRQVRSVASELPQPTEELFQDNRHTQSTHLSPTSSELDSDSGSGFGSDIASDQVSNWLDHTMNPQAREFSSGAGSRNAYQSNAIIIGDGRLSPTKDGSYGRSSQVNIEHNVQRASSVTGVIEDNEMLSSSVYSPVSPGNDFVPTSSSRPSYRYLLENPEAQTKQPKPNRQVSQSQASSKGSRQTSSESRKQHKHPASYVTAHMDDRIKNNKNTRRQPGHFNQHEAAESHTTLIAQHHISQNSAQAVSSALHHAQDRNDLSSNSNQTSNPRYAFGQSQDVRNQDHTSANQHYQKAQTKETDVQNGSDPSIRSIPIYFEGSREDLSQSHYPQAQLHPSYGHMAVPFTPTAFLTAPPSPYGNNFVPPPPSHLNPPGTAADDMYRHFISLHHEIAADTSALKNMITAKHDNIVDRIYQKHDTVVDKLGQGLLQNQQFLHDLSNHLTHVDAHMASNSAGLDVRMRLVQDAVAAAAGGPDRILEEVQNIAKDTGDILNLLNAVNQRFSALEAAVEANKCSCAASRHGTGSSHRGLEGQQRGPQAKTPRKNHAANSGNSNHRLAPSSARADSTGSRPAPATGSVIEEPDIRQHPAFSGITAAAGSSPPVVGGDWYRQVTGKRA